MKGVDLNYEKQKREGNLRCEYFSLERRSVNNKQVGPNSQHQTANYRNDYSCSYNRGPRRDVPKPNV